MQEFSRRQALAVRSAALLATLAPQAEGNEAEKVIVADEKAVLITIKDAMFEKLDEVRRIITVSFGPKDGRIKITGLPLADDFSIRVSLVKPGVVNNVPFDRDRLKRLVGGTVSMLIRAEASGLMVDCVASAND